MLLFQSDLNASTLRRLLTFARDLLQATDLTSISRLIGCTLNELLVMDGAFLNVFLGKAAYLVRFDHKGHFRMELSGSALYKSVLNAMKRGQPIDQIIPAIINSKNNADEYSIIDADNYITISFPPVKPIGTLTVFWNSQQTNSLEKGYASIARHIAELAYASLGNLRSRQELEGEILSQTEELIEVVNEHAREIQKRDDIEEETQRIAATDVLTGLRNRRGFFLQAEQSFKVLQRQGLTGSLIFADIDGLKKINDAFGHDVGDLLIKDSAQILHDSFRESDVVARLGGDEFVAFTFDVSDPEVIMARIREKISVFNMSSLSPYRISLSMGIVQCNPTSSLNLVDYLSIADERMYQQKKECH